MSEILAVSPKCSSMQTRNAILRMKNCSPKLRNVLRQRCQERIHNDRYQILDRMRHVSLHENVKQVLSNILYEEWAKLSASGEHFDQDEELMVEENIDDELISTYENWFLEDYESILAEELGSTTIVCPLCRSGYFQPLANNQIICTKCSVSFSMQKSLAELDKEIISTMSSHNKLCSADPQFVVYPESESKENLFLICHVCSFMDIVLP